MKPRDYEGEIIRNGEGKLTLGELLGTGIEGSVYHVQGSNSDVVKIFLEEKREEKRPKIQAMVSNPPEDPTYKNEGIRSFAWPSKVVVDNSWNNFLGYKMPYIEVDQCKTAQEYAREDLDWGTARWGDIYVTSLNLARTVALLHHSGHGMGDMNHKNIMIRNNVVSLIDCDSFSIGQGAEEHNGKTIHVRYAPPEGRPDELALVKCADRFGLAIHIFQFMMCGFHPFQATGSAAVEGGMADHICGNRFPYKDPDPGRLEPPNRAPSYHRLPQEVRECFERCFIYGKTRPKKRPTAKEWVDVLLNVYESEENLEESPPAEDSPGNLMKSISSDENVTSTNFINAKKKRDIEFPPVTDARDNVSSVLSDSTYRDILDLLEDLGINIEQAKEPVRNLGEESLRDVFLTGINSHYAGLASGETFNRAGKTDIILSYQNSNLFVAECKFWRGSSKYHDTLDQLLNYLTVRDTQAAVLIFSQNDDFQAVKDKVADETRRHERFDTTLTDYEDHNVYQFRQTSNVPVKIATKIFDISI